MRCSRRAWLALLPTAGCALLRPPEPERNVLPGVREIVRDQLVFHSDFHVPRNHRLLDDLAALRGDVRERLDLPTTDEPIHVYLFDAARRYHAYVHERFPEFPERRAFFVETDTRLEVYAHWGDHVAEDLRHEVAHGYLHAVVPNLPLWLDEGLAEYFEVPRGRRGLHAAHVALLRERHAAGDWSPDLPRLEACHSVAALTQLDYAEAWAWVHWLLETTPARRTTLRQYLADLRNHGPAAPLSLVLRQQPDGHADALWQHITDLPHDEH